MHDEERDATAAQQSVEETRRQFVQRARAAAAVPVIVALGMTWASEARASV